MSSQPGAPPTSPPSLSERLQTVTEALAAAHTQRAVFAVVLTPTLQALDAVAGAVLLVDEAGERLEIAATQGHEEGAQTLWQDGPLDGNVPAGDALERREALFFEQEGNLMRAYPELEARTGGVAAATAVLPMFLDGRPLGVIILDFREPHGFVPEERRFLRTLAAQCAIALGRARLTADLQRQVQERTHRIEADARAQEAFVALTEAVGAETDLLALARQAIAVLRDRFQDGSIAYYTRGGDLWKPQVWSEDMGEVLIARLRAGLPDTTPFIRRALETSTPVFTDAWNPEREGIEPSGEYGSAAAYPLVVNGAVRHLLLIGLKDTRRWSERDRALVRAVGRGLTLALERAEQARQLQARGEELEARTLALERFADLTRSQESDPITLIRRAQQAVTELIGEGFAVYFELGGNAWHLKSQVGSPEDATIQASLESALPYETVLNYRIPWESGTPFYLDAYDPALDHGLPGTEALASTAALPLWVGTRRQGMFGYGLKVSRAWTRADRATLETAVNSLGLALERAERTRALEEEREALAAFARFTEGSTHTTDALALAQGAKDVLRATLGVEVGYSELEDGLWKGRVFSETTPPEVMAQSRKGFPADLPAFARPFTERDVVFVDGWDPQGAEHTEVYGAAALYPYFEDGQPHGLLTMGTSEARAWTERERTVFRSVGRSLALAFERAEQARQLQVQNAELDARTRALEGFAELTRDLSVQHEPGVLLERTLALVLSLLPPGFALFYRKSGDRWHVTAQVGSLGTPELQAMVEAGLPVGHTPTLDLPFQTGEPLFQDRYDQARDVAPELVGHLHTVATLPVLVKEEVAGIFNVALFGERRWSPADRAVLETTARSLGLALERAQGVAELEARTREVSEWRERYEVAVKGSGHLLYDWDPATDAIVYGGAVEQITGYTPQELDGHLGDWTHRLIHPEDREAFRQEIARVIESGDEFHLAFRLVREDGQVREVEDDGYFKRDEHGAVTRMAGFVKDVTERRRAEADLRRALHLNELILTSVGEGLIGVDTQGFTTFVNPAAARMTGFMPQDFLGQRAHDLIQHHHADGRPYPTKECGMYAAYRHGDTHHVDSEVYWRADGTPFPVEYVSTPVVSERGVIEGAVVSFRDITERRRAEEKLERSNQELRRSNAELEQFAYIASHDLQAPIRAVTSFAGVIDRRYGEKLDDRGRLYLQQIMESGEHMKRLVDDLLAFSRVHTEQRPLRFTDAGAVFDAVRARLHPEIRALGASVTRGELPQVLADGQQLDQLLQNLITNGLKYRREGVAPEVHVSAEREGRVWRFAVRDNGIGIEPQYFDRIFVIFQRLHGREEYDGTGIGLAVCKKIVERHGGRLWVESQVGHGSTFFFTLPAAGEA